MRYLLMSLSLLTLAACGTESNPGKAPMQRDDKNLNCQQLLLEINDAKFLRYQAEKNKGLSFKNIVWPVGYPQTYSSAAEAIAATDDRINYLSNIYRIKECEAATGKSLE